METRTERKGANGPLDAGGALDPADARDGGARRVLIVDEDAVVQAYAVNLEAERLHVLASSPSHRSSICRRPPAGGPSRRWDSAAGSIHGEGRPER